jgi:hypothetical protein
MPQITQVQLPSWQQRRQSRITALKLPELESKSKPKPEPEPVSGDQIIDERLKQIMREKACDLWQAICWLRHGRPVQWARP